MASEDLTPPTVLELMDMKHQALQWELKAHTLADEGNSEKLQEQVLQVRKWHKRLNEKDHPGHFHLLKSILVRLEKNLNKALSVKAEKTKKQSKTKLSGLFGGQS